MLQKLWVFSSTLFYGYGVHNIFAKYNEAVVAFNCNTLNI